MNKKSNISKDNFYVTLSSTPTLKNKDNLTTDFINTLKDELRLRGEYEVGLSNITFSETNIFDLGTLILSSTGIHGAYKETIKIVGYPCEEYSSLFERINQNLYEIYSKYEYKRRLEIRKSKNIPNGKIYYLENQINIILPNNDIEVDKIFNKEAKECCPKLIFDKKYLKHEVPSGINIKYIGNITNLISDIGDQNLVKYSPIEITNKYLPDFSTVYVLSELIDTENVGEVDLPILKILSSSNLQKSENINFDNNMTYFKVKRSEEEELLKIIRYININIKTKLTNSLSFDLGNIVIRLHFRKINTTYNGL